MPKIPGWSVTEQRNVSDVLGLRGTVYEWTHDVTGETVTIEYDREVDGAEFYVVRFPTREYGDLSGNTLDHAHSIATNFMKRHPAGVDF